MDVGVHQPGREHAAAAVHRAVRGMAGQRADLLDLARRACRGPRADRRAGGSPCGRRSKDGTIYRIEAGVIGSRSSLSRCTARASAARHPEADATQRVRA